MARIPWNKGKRGVQIAWNKGLKGEEYLKHYSNGINMHMKGKPSFFKGKKHSEESKKKMSESAKGIHRGSLNGKWKGGKTISSQGYTLITLPSGKRELEHRLVMEKMIGRKLRKEEEVHHIDFDKTNNHPDNLYLFENGAKHQSYHCILKSFVKEVLGGVI